MAEKARRIVRLAVVASLLAVSLAILLPAFTGRAVVSYASSGSMEPTIGVLDVFFVDPWPDALAIGDIIVYRSVTQGGPAVHRIVGGDASGWITQGDANPAPDQNGGEPLVTGERILGKVVVHDGSPVLLDDLSVPFLEANAQMTRAAASVGGPRQLLALTFLGVAIASATIGVLARSPRAPPGRQPRVLRRALRRAFPRGILGRHVGLALLLFLLVSAGWGAAHARSDVLLQTVVVADDSSADGVRATSRGGTLDKEIEVGGFGFLPTLVVLEAEGRTAPIERVDAAPPGGVARVSARVHAGERAGLQEDTVHAWRYPAVLPAGLLLALHDIAPGLPSFAGPLVLVAVGAAWFAALGIARLPVGRMLGLREDWR